ncbi:hypothetical protein ACHAWF_004354, partial [Thalassiosira exigua]
MKSEPSIYDLSAAKSALTRLADNDPDLSCLWLTREEHLAADANFRPRNSADLSRLGVALGRNTNLRELEVQVQPLSDLFSNNEAFFRGLDSNASILKLAFGQCNLQGERQRKIFAGFVTNMSNLKSLRMLGCALGNGGAQFVASTLSRCPNLESVALAACDIDDFILDEFVLGIRGMNRLRKLSVLQNQIGRAGCESLAKLVRDPNSNLECLRLVCDRNIDDACAAILASSLRGNRKLKRLILRGENHSITESGWDTFSAVLCDASSVEATYQSNHTLRDLGTNRL